MASNTASRRVKRPGLFSGLWQTLGGWLGGAGVPARRRHPVTSRRDGLGNLTLLEDRALLSGTLISAGHITSTKTNAAASLTWTQNGGTGNNRFLMVEVAINGSNSVSSITYAGVALTRIGVSTRPSGPAIDTELWGLVAPATGDNKIIVTLTGPNVDFVAGAEVFTGVNQVTPYGSFIAAYGTGSSPSVSVAAATNELVVGVGGSEGVSASSATAGEMALWNRSTGSTGTNAWGAAASATGSSTTTLSWTNTYSVAGDWSAGAVALLPSTISVSKTSLTTSESGTSASFSVVLPSQPASTVTLSLTNGNPSEGSLSTTTLTFTTSNWNTAQTVTVTGLDDHIINGDQTYQITGTASSADTNFNGLAMTPVSVTNTEADAAGIQVNGSTLLIGEDNKIVRVNSITGAVIATYATGVANDGLAVGADGSLYVADYNNNQVLRFDPSGKLLSSFGSTQLIAPQGLAFGPNGNLYVTCTNGPGHGFVDEFSPTGSFVGTFIASGSGGLSNAKAIVWGPDGNAYVSSYFNSEVIRYNGTTGAFLNVFATGSGGFEGLAFGPNGNLYVASYGNNSIERYDGNTGAHLSTFVSGVSTPYGLTFDASGNLDVASQSAGKVLVYDGKTGAAVGTLTSVLTNPSYLASTTSLVTSETGTSATFSVALTSQPTAGVTISLAPSLSGEGTLSQSTLTFDSSNWNTAQTVTVTGLDDHIVHGDQTYQITGAAISTDANYNNATMTAVAVTNTEADSVGFTVTPTSIQTSMAGASASFSVALTSQPVAPVTVNLGSTNSAEGSLSQTALTFDATNWNVAQSITVTGQLDLTATGNVTYQINGTASSSDNAYNGQAMAPVTVTNVQSGLPGFVITPTTLTTSEQGTSQSFTVALASLPLGFVTVNLTNGNPAEGSLSTNSLTFSTLDWSTPQTVTVTGLDDQIVHGNQTYQITGSATSLLDLSYNGLTMTPVTVTNTEADVAGFSVTPGALTTSESGTAASFSVALTSKPTATVTLTLAPTDPGQGSLSQTTLTFDASNWNVAQTVTVTGLNSYMTTPSVTYYITGSAASGDANYGGLTMTPVTVTNTETPNLASVTLSSGTNSVVYGQTVTLTVSVAPVGAMTGTPTGTVTIYQGTTALGAVQLSNGSANYTTSSLPVGTYTFSAAYGGDAYFTGASSTSRSVAVTRATLTVRADDVSRVYGQANPTLTFSVSGFVNGDTTADLSGSPVLTTAATSARDVGGYAIRVHQATLRAANYDFAFVDGTLTITPATLTVTANDASRPFGQPNPVFSATITGFVNGDGLGAVSGRPALTTSATAASGVGTYAISAGPGSLGAVNYTFTYQGGTLTITAAVGPTGPPSTPGIPSVPAASGSPTPTDSGALSSLVAGNTASAPLAGDTASAGATGSSQQSSNFQSAPASSQLATTTTGSIGTSAAERAVGAPGATGDGVVYVAASATSSVRRDDNAGLAAQSFADLVVPAAAASPSPAPVPVETVELPPLPETPVEGTDRRSHGLPPVDLPDASETNRERRNWAEQMPDPGLVAATGLVATAGYVLLNTRAISWLLSLLSARPAWKQLDPLEVIYAWEQDGENDDDESLVSLVDAAQ